MINEEKDKSFSSRFADKRPILEEKLKEEREVIDKRAEDIEEKKEFLEREEIKTMGKDISNLREIGARKEREKLTGLKIEEETPTEQQVEPEVGALISKLSSKKLNSSKKILVRVIIIAACFLVLGSLVWFFIIPELLPEQVINQEPVMPEPEPEPKLLMIIERTINWGHHFPVLPRTIDTIIIHSVFNSLDGDVHQVEKVIQEYELHRVATHYLIGRDGSVYRLVPRKAIAHHAGYSQMPDGSRVNIVNNFSIGIGLIYTKEESPIENQYQSLVKLVKELQQKYNIPFEKILGHKDISPDRVNDPWNFNWNYFHSLVKYE